MSVCLCFERRRSNNFKVLLCIRRLSAWALALDLKISFRWVPSEANCSDEPSRKFDPDHDLSKAVVGNVFDSVVPCSFKIRTATPPAGPVSPTHGSEALPDPGEPSVSAPRGGATAGSRHASGRRAPGDGDGAPAAEDTGSSDPSQAASDDSDQRSRGEGEAAAGGRKCRRSWRRVERRDDLGRDWRGGVEGAPPPHAGPEATEAVGRCSGPGEGHTQHFPGEQHCSAGDGGKVRGGAGELVCERPGRAPRNRRGCRGGRLSPCT